MAMATLSGVRARMYPWTRPAFALLGGTTAAAFDAYAPPSSEAARPLSTADSSRLAALPALLVGTAGVYAVATRYGRLCWLAHPYEAWAWGLAYGGLAAAAGATLVGCSEHYAALLAPSAGAALAATAGERLGSVAGRALAPALVSVGLLSAGAALAGDARGERAARALQASALVLLPSLQLVCLPVYTLSVQGALAGAWLWMAAAVTAFDAPLASSPEDSRHVLVAVGAASLLRTLATRAPVCQF